MEDPCGWVKLFHPSGVQVTLPLMPDATNDYLEKIPSSLFAQVDAFLKAGFLVYAPGLEEGESREECGYVVRREKENQDHSITPIIDFYPIDGKFSFLSHYLNNDDAIQDFLKAAGLDRLQSLPLYDGDNKIERGKGQKTDKYVHKVNPFGVVFVPNPKWKQEEAQAAAKEGKMYPVPKRRFVRYEAGKVGKAPEKTEQQKPVNTTDQMVNWWKGYLAKDPPLAEVTDNWKRFVSKQTAEVIQAVEDGPIDAWKALSGAWWDAEGQEWQPPKESDDDTVPF